MVFDGWIISDYSFPEQQMLNIITRENKGIYMKKTKRIITLFTAIMLVITLLGTNSVFAIDELNDGCVKSGELNNIKVIESLGYDFIIHESIGEDHSVTRDYYRSENKKGELSHEETIALLYALGMNETEVTAYTENDLQEFAATQNLSVSVYYSKQNEETGETTYLSEKTALAEVKANLEERELKKAAPDSSKSGNPYIDSYMRITISSSLVTGTTDTYRLSTHAIWLTMPAFRWKDAVGISANRCNVVPGTEYAYYTYTQKIITDDGTTTSTIKRNITGNNIENPVNGNWFGAAGLFSVPKDLYDPDIDRGLICSNLYAYIACTFKVAENGATSFNASGSYAHSKVSVSVSIGLDFGKGYGGGVAITPTIKVIQESRAALKLITL